jgi:ABC-type bacteriocin/lantibiotic exporter with double-glycine peptidase domain
MRARSGARLIVPEVVQTSAMDCGPASLKCLLEGFGIAVSYGRLREACQTDVDGTSIDTLESVAVQLGLQAEQVMIPADHLLVPQARALPAIVVVRLAGGTTHFVVAWRRHGGVIQVMDPGTGRRWPASRRFLDELYLHAMPVPAADWRDWAGSGEFLEPLAQRLGRVGCSNGQRERIVAVALGDPGWRPIAALDAATRMTSLLVRAGGLRRGRQAVALLERTFDRVASEPASALRVVPTGCWTVVPHLARPSDADAAGGEAVEPVEQVELRGAVLVRALGVTSTGQAERREPGALEEPRPTEAPALPLELVAALEEPQARPGRDLLRLLRADGLLAPAALVVALALASAGVLVETLLLRGLFDVGRVLGLATQRVTFVGAVVLLVVGLLLVELPIAATVLRLGRHLETRLRVAFLTKIPRLGDRYFHSRLTSDMAERSHMLPAIRGGPGLGAQMIRSCFGLALTVGGLIWLDPPSAVVAVLVATIAVLLPIAAQRLVSERDLRVRSHAGALSRFYLDALLGLVPVRTHGAERAIRREHESLLVEWARASTALLRVAVPVDGVIALTGMALAGWLLVGYLGRVSDTRNVLLFAYWALNLPAVGHAVALVAQQYPAQRNVALRLLEPLGAPEEEQTEASAAPPAAARPRGAALRLEAVSVRAGGHTILEGIDLEIPAGGQVAIVGPSGAGKSSLVGLLLGWHRPAEGQVLVDGLPVGAQLDRLRRETAWVDPAVQLWNRSLLHNLRYGVADDGGPAVGAVLEAADLRRVLEGLPEGMQTTLGESGALVSGGEGQRVRLGRAMGRADARLVILDEPFRGLDRQQRRELLERARRWWGGATLLCITHDLPETAAFDRVLVIDGGRVVEDGSPAALAARPGSRYAALLEEERVVREGLWSGPGWRRLRLEGGRLEERAGDADV